MPVCRQPCRSFSPFSTSSSSNTICIAVAARRSTWQRVFGGQIIAQALVAAQRTVDARPPRAFAAWLLHAAGRHHRADRLRGRPHPRRRLLHHAARASRSSTARRSSRSRRPSRSTRTGLDHQFPMPLDVPAPDTLMDRQRGHRASMATRVPEQHQALLGARPADRDEAGHPEPLYQPREAAAACSTSGSAPPARCRTIARRSRPCSPISPT